MLLHEAIEALEAAIPRLGTSADFARSLIDQYRARGLSERQAEWVHRLVARANTPAPALGNVRPILDLFNRAHAAGIRFPRIRLRTADGGRVVLSMAGERSRDPGSLTVTDGGAYGVGAYYGRIMPDGGFRPARACTPNVELTLRELATDPAGRAAIHGHATGECTFCGRELTDGRSIAVGYGPVCAERFGLPWGEESAEPVTVEIPTETSEV